MEATIPPFNPRFITSPGMGHYFEDGRMVAAVDVHEEDGRKSIVISEWSSLFPGNGHSEEALKWLRSQGFKSITANGVGLIEDGVGDIATVYWQHMHSKGLVDTLIDDDGIDVTPPLIQLEMRRPEKVANLRRLGVLNAAVEAEENLERSDSILTHRP